MCNLLQELSIHFNWRIEDSQKKLPEKHFLTNLVQIGVFEEIFSGNVVKGDTTESSVINI